jgi:hypothetical protein
MTCWCCELEQNHCFINLAVNICLKGVNWNQTIVPEWESNPRHVNWNRSMFGNGPLTHENVYDHQILLYYIFFFYGYIFIPWSWWWRFSNVDKWVKLPMKLDIVYLDTISLIEFHCTVYEKCIVGQFIRDWRLKTCLVAKCVFYAAQAKEKFEIQYFVLVGGGL